MKKYIFLFQFFFCLIVFGQNKKIIYGFDKIPQTLLLNPGAETTFKYHVGVPLFSGVSANVNSSGITIADVFRDDKLGIFSGKSFSNKLTGAINNLSDNDYAYANSQIDILNLGMKMNYRDYLSAGFYIEANAFATLPKDLGILATQGNANHLEKTFSIGQFSSKNDVLGVWHVGISRRMNNKLTVGGRLKIYSGALNATSVDNGGGFSTHLLDSDVYEHILSGLNVEANTSGIYDENKETNVNASSIISKSFFSANLGLGLDLGFTYHINEQSEITGSLLDVGFVNYSKNIRNFLAKGTYVTQGYVVNLFDGLINSWDIDDVFDEKIERTENTNSYMVMRTVKAYGAYAYSFGKSKNRANCHDNTYKDFFDNTVGGQIFTAFQPNGINIAFTGYYQRKISKHLNTKITYTVDKFSSSNIGLGVSLNIWKMNIYGSLDNIFLITDIADGHTSSAQVGVNFILN